MRTSINTFKCEGETHWGKFSQSISYADINGDQYDDIIILASDYSDYENPLGKIYIYTYNKITDIQKDEINSPVNFILYQNYPNPFNPSTTISYTLQIRGHVELKIYNVLGNEICTLINKEQIAGEYMLQFEASKYYLTSGIYFCELKIEGGGVERIKMALIK